MPWRLRKRLALTILGCIALALAIVVIILNQDVSTEVLAGIGILGGVAIVVNSLPDKAEDGDDKT